MTNEKIKEIFELINQRKMLEVKKLLNELDIDLENLQKFFDEIKSLVRNQGKSSLMSVSEIEEVIEKYEK